MSKRADSRTRLTFGVTAALKRRIKIAAAAQDMQVSLYVEHVLEQAVPPAGAVGKTSNGVVTSTMMRHADRLRAKQKAPFPEDSTDLIRESRKHRHAHMG